METRTRNGLRDRARIVCVTCHARKIKCDLVTQQNGVCRNCQKHGLKCRRRVGQRTSTLAARFGSSSSDTPAAPKHSQQVGVILDSPSQDEPSKSLFHVDLSHLPNESPEASQSWTAQNHASTSVADDTLSLPSTYRRLIAASDAANQQLLETTHATSLPSEVLLKAAFDSYYEYLFHRMPILDPQDVITHEGRSIVVCQAVCLTGFLLRHPSGPDVPSDADQFWIRLRMLLFTNHERDFVNVLKALCLLMVWNVGGFGVVTFDSSWHWLGQAIRLLLQMGLHKESTYAELQPETRRANARRIAWSIYVQDKLFSACYGRPCAIRPADFDLRPLAIEEFQIKDRKAEISIEWMRLGQILGELLDAPDQPSNPAQPESSFFLDRFRAWIQGLPDHLTLYDRSAQRPYKRDTYELHIFYFVSLIYFLHVRGAPTVPVRIVRVVSLVASSCAVSLYEEIMYRDDVNYLQGINNWFLMMVALPQLQHDVRAPGEDSLCQQHLETLVAVLGCMEVKTPGATAILRAIQKVRDLAARQALHRSSIDKASVSGDGQQLAWLRGLFPFPDSVTPRLTLLDDSSEPSFEFSVLSPGEDLDAIFNEMTDISYDLSFFNSNPSLH